MSRSSQFFRANVGAVMCDARGRVLGFERSDHAGAWQLPQGGLEVGEEPDTGVLREVREETGIGSSFLDALGRHPQLLAYELPPDLRSDKVGRGQVQYWFYFRTSAEPQLEPGGEFGAWRWMDLRDLAAGAVEFRRPIYEQLLVYYEHVVRRS